MHAQAHSLTVEYVDRDGGLRVPHAAGVVARVGLGGARDVQPRHRAVPQQVRLHAADRWGGTIGGQNAVYKF